MHKPWISEGNFARLTEGLTDEQRASLRKSVNFYPATTLRLLRGWPEEDVDQQRIGDAYLALYAEHEQRQADERHFWRCIRLGGCERHQGWLNRAPFSGWDVLARRNGKTAARMAQMPPGWREFAPGFWTAPVNTPAPS